MKKLLFVASLLFISTVANFSCSPSEESLISPGDWIFWTSIPLYSSKIIVIVDQGSHTGNITALCTTLPVCGDSRCYTVDLKGLGITQSSPDGTFDYTALDSLSPTQVRRWSGTIVVTKDNFSHCNSTEFHL